MHTFEFSTKFNWICSKIFSVLQALKARALFKKNIQYIIIKVTLFKILVNKSTTTTTTTAYGNYTFIHSFKLLNKSSHSVHFIQSCLLLPFKGLDANNINKVPRIVVLNLLKVSKHLKTKCCIMVKINSPGTLICWSVLLFREYLVIVSWALGVC